MDDLCSIRAARADDDLTALWRPVYVAQHAPLLKPGETIPFCPLGEAFVAEISGAAVGFVCVEDHWLNELWVSLPWQRRGVGSKLLAFAESAIRARGHPLSQLNVMALNAPAIAFYERHGWQREPGTLGSVTGVAFLRFSKAL